MVLAKTTPEPVEIEFNDKKGEATSLLPIKIKSVLAMINASVKEIQDDKNIILDFTYNGKPVSSLNFKYNDGQSIVGPIVARDGIGEDRWHRYLPTESYISHTSYVSATR